jgi:hypothetical protein
VSRKTLAKHTGAKAAYKVPKSAGKQARYLNSLTALLALTTAQQQQASVIFANANGTRASVHSSLKAARKALSDAVRANDAGAISQASTALGALTSQHISNGALANAEFLPASHAGSANQVVPVPRLRLNQSFRRPPGRRASGWSQPHKRVTPAAAAASG